MELFLHGFCTILYLSTIVLSCIIFTNAIENLGLTLKIASNAVGSVFAAIGTTLPETIVPLVAILGVSVSGTGADAGSNIGIGAILGSSFLISTMGMFLTGCSVLFFAKTKKRGSEICAPQTFFIRDLRFFVLAYIIAIFTSFIPFKSIKYLIVVFLIFYYIFYATRTIMTATGNEEGNAEELLLCKICKTKLCLSLVITQLLISFLFLIFSAHLFVNEISYFSKLLNISPIILSIIISPIATELPEIINSIIWTKNEKDILALSNLSGALVFQGSIPMAIGIALTPWKFDYNSIVNITMVLMSILVLYGNVKFSKKIKIKALLTAGFFYVLFIAIVFFNYFLTITINK